MSTDDINLDHHKEATGDKKAGLKVAAIALACFCIFVWTVAP